MYRRDNKQQWVRIGEAGTMSEALMMVSGTGDWWLHQPHDEDEGLFEQT